MHAESTPGTNEWMAQPAGGVWQGRGWRSDSGARSTSPWSLAGGACVALYLLTGRWSVSRVLPDSGGEGILSYLVQPRQWLLIALLMVLAVVAIRGSERAASLSSQPSGFKRLTLILICLFLYLIVTLLWTPDKAEGLSKAYEIGLHIIVLFALSRLLSDFDPVKVKLGFWWTFAVAAALLMLSAFLMPSHAVGARTAAMGGGPNAFGRNAALLWVSTMCLSDWCLGNRRHSRLIVTGLVLAAAVSPLLVLASGSRGAMVALIGGAIVFSLTPAAKRLKRPLLFLIGALVLTTVLYTTRVGEIAKTVFADRVVKLTIEQRYLSSRDGLFRSALEYGLEHPIFGAGIQAFRSERVFGGMYPHNLILELFCEGGVIAVGLLLLAFAGLVRHMYRWRHRADWMALSAFVVAFLSSQVSGDLFDSRGVFIFLILASTMPVTTRRQVQPAPRQLYIRYVTASEGPSMANELDSGKIT